MTIPTCGGESVLILVSDLLYQTTYINQKSATFVADLFIRLLTSSGHQGTFTVRKHIKATRFIVNKICDNVAFCKSGLEHFA